MSLLEKAGNWLTRPRYAWHRILSSFYAATNYDYRQWSRVVMYRELFDEVRRLDPAGLSVLEISPGGGNTHWRALGFAEYMGVDYPDFDICKDRLDRQFDLIIADQVFEHLLWPYRAARNVHQMLKPQGRFINTTPFLIRVHEVPVDCTRWTETGMKHLLAEAGFELAKIRTGSWGNRACVSANLTAREWAPVGWGKSLKKEADFPVSVWAIAEK